MSCATTCNVQDDQSSVLPAAARCSYAFKFCNNPRALKTTGALHKLCEFHRQKANLNQKRLQEKHRKERGAAPRDARQQRRCHPYQLQLQPQRGLQHEQRPHRFQAAAAFNRGLSFTDIDDILQDCSSTAFEPVPAREVTTDLKIKGMPKREPYEISL